MCSTRPTNHPCPAVVSAANCTTNAYCVGSRGPGRCGGCTCVSSVPVVCLSTVLTIGREATPSLQITHRLLTDYSQRAPQRPHPPPEERMSTESQFGFDVYRLDLLNEQLWCG